MVNAFRLVRTLFFLFVVTLGLMLLFRLGEARGDDVVSSVAQAVRTLQPGASVERAEELARVIVDAGRETELDPLLITAITFRESSFARSRESLESLGERGERGLMQVHGVALRFRPDACPHSLEGAECQIRTGARFLAYCREACPGSQWRWVGAYGMSRCPSEQEAGMMPSVRVVARYHREIGGSGW